ncbi:hypothetical protein QAD02_006299 [Eretmocerus hayati]|uniref:Uncharacterized protein n=1 Tax=Eretmocerus hayati TaxID=131215 RepID=A0ACC2N0L8_9HYME|nr:hypothetical protein QAD02_006299 [Eretmocerus hayati]
MKSIQQVIIVLCGVTIFGCHTLEIKSFKREWKLQRNVTFYWSRRISNFDNSFLYAACSEQGLPEEIKCNVTIETPSNPWNSNSTHKDTCKLRLSANLDSRQKNEITKLVSVDRFADRKAILVWWERPQNSQFQIQNIKVSILNMEFCVTTHLTFPVDVDRHILTANLVLYPNSFEVTISNRKICGTDACRVTHDINGLPIGSPNPFSTGLVSSSIKSVSLNSSEKGFYVSGSDIGAWKFRAMKVNPNGDKTNLIKVSVSDPRHVYSVSSNAHEYYGICLMGERKVYCAQFDDKASVRLNATLKVPGSTQWIGVHNLAEGGLLLLSGNCNGDKCRNFKVTRIKSSENHDEPVEVADLQIKCSNVPQELVVDTMEYGNDVCFYFACAHAQETPGKGLRKSLRFSSKCLNKQAFGL